MAVYTDVSFEDLEAFLQPYDIGTPHVFKGIAEGVSNSNYTLQTEKGAYILTLYERRVREEDLPFYPDLMEHLARAGLACPTPVHAAGGALTGTLNGRPAAILTFLDGVSLRWPGPEHCAAAGRALATLHQLGASFGRTRKNSLSLAGWRKLAADCAGDADKAGHGFGDLIETEIAHLSQCWPENLPRGIIHADFFPDNVLFVDNKVSGVIDFYFACTDFLVYDIAIALNAWCFEKDGSFNVTKSRALIAGYQSSRSLGPEERSALPVLSRGAALRFLLTRTYDWLNHDPGALVRPKAPGEFAQRLRFHRGVRGPDAYGL
ncbi:MAG: homoserine kinase [Proteobacteria bacterium]|nr:homoserine kinase [Pseudomonadota bacterium]